MTSKGKLATRLAPLAAFGLLVVALISVNVLAAYVPLRLDVTEERLYTLSKGSREILQGIKEPITLKLYYSSSQPDIPVSFQTYSTKVIELLRQYAAAAPRGKLRLEVYDPAPDTDEEEWATRYGLSPARMPSGDNLYFGLVVVAANQEATVPFFDPRRERFLEYDVSQAITRVQEAKQPKIGLLSYLPIGYPAAPTMGQRQQQKNWAILQELQKSFDVDMLEPDTLVQIPSDLRVVLVVHPKHIPPRISYALDQFVLRGGKLVVLVDPNSRIDALSGGQYGAPTNSSLDTLFKAWGIKYDKLEVVGDHELATRVNSPQFGVVDYPIWISITPKYLNREQVITSQLDDLTFIDAGRFQTDKDFKLNFTPLATSSPNSGMVDFTSVRLVDPVTLSKMVKSDGQTKVLAALVTGKFPTAYPDGPPPEPTGKDKEQLSKDVEAQLAQRKAHFISKATAESSVVLIADADFIADQFSVQQVNFFGNVVTQPINDNLNLVLNSAEYLAGNQALIHIRSRGKFSRPFTRVQALQVKAAAKYNQQEQALSDKLDAVKRKLNELERQRPKGSNLMLSPEQVDALHQYRLEEQRTRHALREVRKVLRQDIETLGNILLSINLLAMPLLVAVVGFVIIIRRSRRSGGKR
ncbi:MAG TPA: GldG family protein [bacterium]|nr:GldG family protein [bacterium]